MRLSLWVVAGLLSTGLIPAALAADAATEAALRPRVLSATPVRGPAPVLDGRLDEAAWSGAEVATDFVQRRPTPGALASVRTEARLLFDEHALYVGVRAFDPEPARILAPWPRRDDEITSDWIFVELDSRHDRRTAFSFGVNPRGVQVDGVFLADVQYDTAWDAVWQAAARIDGDGWTAEFRIPFSQLSYSAEAAPEGEPLAEATWGLNVYRYAPGRGESSNWSPRLPSVAGVVSRFNELRLRVPAHAGRLQVAPYAAARLTRVPGDNPLAEGQALSAGARSRSRPRLVVRPERGHPPRLQPGRSRSVGGQPHLLRNLLDREALALRGRGRPPPLRQQPAVRHPRQLVRLRPTLLFAAHRERSAPFAARGRAFRPPAGDGTRARGGQADRSHERRVVGGRSGCDHRARPRPTSWTVRGDSRRAQRGATHLLRDVARPA